jgi:tRNA nucleotidyltransferase (CCA-adding enzyme)
VLLAATPDDDARAALERFHWPKRLGAQRAKLRAALATPAPLTDALLGALEAPTRRALAALAPVHAAAVKAFEHAPPEPRLRGRDVVALGLVPGPAVGAVLAEVDRARADGRVHGFEQERALARRLVAAHAEADATP